MKVLIVTMLLVWIGGCATQYAQHPLLLKAPTIESNPPSFTESWGNGKTQKEGDHSIVRKENSCVYIISPETNGKKDGVARRYDKASKQIRFETAYKNGIKEGWSKRYSPEGGWLYEAVLYHNGEKRELREYNQKGEVIHIVPYLDGKKHGVEQKFSYINGDLEYRIHYDRGTKKKLIRYCKGKPDLQMQMDGCRQGMEREWWCGTATLKRETPYRNCKRNGIEKHYDASGHLLYRVTYRNGLKEGPAKAYYPNGKVKYSLVYHKDEPEEIAYHYDVSGKKERIDYDTLVLFAKRFPKGYSEWWKAI